MENTLFGIQPLITISYSNDEIIKNIMQLYGIERFDLDCTYSKGVFWKNLPDPIHKTDLKPQRKDVIEADSGNLPFDNNQLKSIMFDPPFVIAGKTYADNKKGSSIISKRFEGYQNFQELKSHYNRTLIEAARILKDEGVLVFKCQDVVSSGKNHFTHCMVMEMGIKAGFNPKDLFILLAKNRINSFNGSKWKQQQHARKHHSYFWVFKKGKCKVNYDFG